MHSAQTFRTWARLLEHAQPVTCRWVITHSSSHRHKTPLSGPTGARVSAWVRPSYQAAGPNVNRIPSSPSLRASALRPIACALMGGFAATRASIGFDSNICTVCGQSFSWHACAHMVHMFVPLVRCKARANTAMIAMP